MVVLSFINPLSSEGREILGENINLDNVFEENEELIDVVNHTNHQNISNDSKIPKNYIDLALMRIGWYFRKKSDKEFKNTDFNYLFNEDIAKFDVVVYHLLAQAIAYKFNIKSREAKLFIEAQGKLIEERLIKLNPIERHEIVDKILSQLTSSSENIKWTEILPLISTKKISLTDLVLSDGKIIIDKEDFVDKFKDKFTDRSPDRIYDILIGYKVKELILTQLIVQNTENYIESIKEKLATIEVHPIIEKLANLIEEEIKELNDKYSTLYGRSGYGEGDFEIAKLQKEAFPPCVIETINGVKSGNRNDAIVLFLTSFISYARLNPSVFRMDRTVNISDVDYNLNITFNEILPIINEAAENCVPPLFEDQPQEKINIVSKLGFGMHSEPKLENEGETKWYTPMSCEKIKLHLGNLCKSDKICKTIGNPLSYYSKRKWQLAKEGNSSNQEETQKKGET